MASLFFLLRSPFGYQHSPVHFIFRRSRYEKVENCVKTQSTIQKTRDHHRNRLQKLELAIQLVSRMT